MYIYIYIYIYSKWLITFPTDLVYTHIPNPFATSRMWHKFSFSVEKTSFELRFSLS